MTGSHVVAGSSPAISTILIRSMKNQVFSENLVFLLDGPKHVVMFGYASRFSCPEFLCVIPPV